MFGVVTTENIRQAMNVCPVVLRLEIKGYDCAMGAVEMVNISINSNNYEVNTQCLMMHECFIISMFLYLENELDRYIFSIIRKSKS